MENSTTNTARIDHGITLVHDVTHEPSHYLHEVSVPWGTPGPAGFTWLHGWVDRDPRGARRWALYFRTLPLEPEPEIEPAAASPMGPRFWWKGLWVTPELARQMGPGIAAADRRNWLIETRFMDRQLEADRKRAERAARLG